jgi:hypothetical protein
MRRHPILTVILFLILVGAISSAFSHGKGSGSSSGLSASDLSASDVSAAASVPITGHVTGALQDATYCLGCGRLTKYIHVDGVWCGWQGSQVVIHARFRNDSVEHVTIHWHPSYTIAGGDSHGGGLTSIQSIGLDANAIRGSYVKQSPKGVTAGSAIGTCQPALEDVSSG